MTTPETLDFTFMATFHAGQAWFPKLRGPYVTYLRFSDNPHSRLRVDAQREAINAILSPGRARLVGEFLERATVRTCERLELEKAIAACREAGAALVFGRLDGMRGRLALLDRLFIDLIKFRAADLPHLYPSSFYQLKVAEDRRRQQVGDAVRAALEAAKKNGARLGGPREHAQGLILGPSASAIARGRRANSRDRLTMTIIEGLQKGGITSYSGIAGRLNQMGSKAPRGGSWSAVQVRRIVLRLGK